MSDPTPVVRAVTYERDGHACVSCGARKNLQYQHRAATGMGGSKVRPRYEDGVTSCATCNDQYENVLQRRALLCGWKVARWVRRREDVPVFYPMERQWFRLTTQGRRVPLGAAAARALMVDVYGDEYAEWEKAGERR